MLRKSVHQILRDVGKPIGASYDLVYCAGLFDYLSDNFCQRLMEILYNWVAPGGLLLATNLHPSNPLRNGMEHLLEWNLVYRDAQAAAKLKPQAASAEHFCIESDLTGVDIFLAVRKPNAL